MKRTSVLAALAVAGSAAVTGVATSPATAGPQAGTPAGTQAGTQAGPHTGVPVGDRSRDRLGSTVIEWNATAGRAALAACIAPLDNPLHESRMYAMAMLAVHDALNAIDRRSRSYAADFTAPLGADAGAAVAAAARDALVAGISDIGAPFPQACVDAGTAVVEDAYASALAGIRDGRAKSDGLAVGRRAAAAVIATRTGDGADTPLVVTDHPQGTEPGEWRFTPGTDFAFAPGWGGVRPFVLASADQVPVAPPLTLDGRRYARDVNEVKALGGDGVSTPTIRTAEQTQIALWWWESSPLSWNRIARQLATTRHLDAWEQARLFGLLDAAMADGYVASFEAKYANAFWRPVTAIREADTDGNPRTVADPAWQSLVTTPPIPDHDSAHAVEGGAAAEVFRRFFGTDRMTFDNCSNTLPLRTCSDPDPILRHWTSFRQAAQENADSRIYIGFHFRRATEVGLDHGTRIGRIVATTALRPVHRAHRAH